MAAGTVTPRMPTQQEGAPIREAGRWSKMVDNLHLYALILAGKSHEQAVLWVGELYVRLVEEEKVADKALLHLADKRAQAIAAHLTGKSQIAKERLRVEAPEPLTDSEQPTVPFLWTPCRRREPWCRNDGNGQSAPPQGDLRGVFKVNAGFQRLDSVRLFPNMRPL